MRSLSRFHQDDITITMIHVDSKTNITYFKQLEQFVKEKGFKHVYFSSRFSVHWGHHSVKMKMFVQLIII